MRLLKFLVVAALLLTGCAATVETYYAHERPASPAIVKESDGIYCQMINAFMTDAPKSGLLFPGIPKSYSIKPGDVKVSATYCRNNSFGQIKSVSKEVTFVAEAGHTYAFKSDVPLRVGFATIAGPDWDLSVIDQANDAVVVATHDRPTK